jgi:hypothetical protein
VPAAGRSAAADAVDTQLLGQHLDGSKVVRGDDLGFF